jgi:predicted RNase H-like HicB family nuclease
LKLGVLNAFSVEGSFMSRGKKYTISDGKMVLHVEEAEGGGFVVTSPLDPELVTEAESLEEAFVNAHDAARALKESRAKLIRRSIAVT